MLRPVQPKTYRGSRHIKHPISDQHWQLPHPPRSRGCSEIYTTTFQILWLFILGNNRCLHIKYMHLCNIYKLKQECNILCKCIILDQLLYDDNYISEHNSTDRNIFFTKPQDFYIIQCNKINYSKLLTSVL